MRQHPGSPALGNSADLEKGVVSFSVRILRPKESNIRSFTLLAGGSRSSYPSYLRQTPSVESRPDIALFRPCLLLLHSLLILKILYPTCCGRISFPLLRLSLLTHHIICSPFKITPFIIHISAIQLSIHPLLSLNLFLLLRKSPITEVTLSLRPWTPY